LFSFRQKNDLVSKASHFDHLRIFKMYHDPNQ